MFSRQWICCLKWGACISTCVSFGSLPKMYPTEIGFEFTHGDLIGAAVPRLKQSATLAIFWQNQNNAVYSALVFFLVLPDMSNILYELECTHLCELLSGSFLNWLLSRHWVCCSDWGACNSALLSFGALPKRIPTEMGFEPTQGNRIGLAVQRRNHSAIDKSQKLLSIVHFSLSLHYQICPTSWNWSMLTFVCCFSHLLWTRCSLYKEFVA